MSSLMDIFLHEWLFVPYKLHVTTHGSKKNPTVVLLHGLAVDSGDWQEFIKKMKDNYYCVTIDLLGFGKSAKPQWANYSLEDHLRSIRYTMHHTNLPKTYILIGHSLGSLLATRIALREAKHISHLFLLSPPVYPPLDQIKPFTARKYTGLLLAAYRFIRSEKMTPKLFDRMSRILPLPRNVLLDQASWLPAMRTLKNCIENQRILDDAKKLRVQTDVYYGSYDQVVIGKNVKLLERRPIVTTHKFIGDHFLTRAYAEVVSRNLLESQNHS